MFKINLMLMDIYAFADRTFTLMLAYRRQSMQMQEVIRMLQYFLATISIDIIAGDFNFDILKESENKLSDILTHHFQIVNKQAYTSGSLIEHVYITKTLMEEFFNC